MFKVECLGCRAPYQVDERRVPAAGLKMRCPKCGTSFKVEAPSAGASPAAGRRGKTPAPVAGGFQPVTGSVSKRAKLSRTMIGVSSDLAAKAPAQKGGGFKMPRPGAEHSEEPASGSVEEPPSSALEDEDVPAVLSGTFSPPPSSKGPPSETVPESLVEPSRPLSLSELPPPVRGQPSALAFEQKEAELAASAGALELESDLPLAATQAAKPPPRRPRPPAPPRRKAGTDEAHLPAPVKAPAEESSLELDLPAAVGEASDPLEAELPALMSRSGNEGLDLDLPAVAGGVQLDLDTSGDEAESALPIVSKATAVTRSDLPANMRSDLPAVVSPGGADLPAVALTHEAELPSLTHADLPGLGGKGATDLPTVSTADLPAVGAAGLPAVGGADLPAVGSPDLPTVSAQLPTVAGRRRRDDFGSVDLLEDSFPSVQEASLPEVHGGLPVVQASLPEVQGSLPEVQGSLPEVQGALPEVQGSLPEVQGSLPEVQGSLPEVQGSLPEVQGVLPDKRSGDRLELDDFGESDAEEGLDGIGDEFDLGQLGAQEVTESDDEFSFPPTSDPFGSDEDDPFEGGDDLGLEAGAFGSSEPPEVSRDPDGGYGELDIGAGDDNVSLETEDMEFSSIPQQDSNRSPAMAAATAQVHRDPDLEAGASTLELERPRAKPSRVRRVAFAASVALLIVAGGALSLDPRLGPFGFHFVMDQVKRPEHEKLLSTSTRQALELLGKDTLAEARKAVKLSGALTERAPRFLPARAHAATVRYAVVLRFGPLPELEAAAKKLMAEIPADAQAPSFSLARAAQASTASFEQADSALEALGANPFALGMRAELALRAGKAQEAKEIFQRLAQEGATAATLFGVARSEMALGNLDAARAAAAQVRELSSEHIGSVVLELDAHRAARHAQDGAAGSKKKAAAPVDGGTTERLMQAVKKVLPAAAPSEAAYAHTVLGELEVEYGRNAPAQESFEKALAMDRVAPRALMGLGEVLYSSGRYTEALARYRAAAEVRPKSLAAKMGLIKCQIELGHTPEAQQLLKALLEAHPDNADLVFWSARAHEAMDQNDAALIAYRKAIDAGKGRVDSVKAYLALANLQSRLEQLSQAKKTLREAQEKLPPSAELSLTLGRLDMSDGSYESALNHFQAALALDTADTRAQFAVGTALARLRRFDQALEQFERVATTDRDYPGLALERGRVYEISGRNDQALSEYEAALTKAPEDQEMQLRVGCSRVVAGKVEEAKALLEPLVDARPRSAEVQHCMGRALFEEGRYVVASRHLERATSLDGQHAIYHLYVGWSALKLGRSSEAESALRRSIELDSGLGDAYWLLGSLRRKQGAVQDAVDYLKTALELNPRRVEALSDLAMAYAELDQPKLAAATWAQAVEAKPDEPTWRFRYSKLLSTQGRLNEVIPHLREALRLEQASRSQDATATGRVAAWVAQAHYLLGRALKGSPESVKHWQAYLRLSDRSHPYRAEAMSALSAMGQPWKQRP